MIFCIFLVYALVFLVASGGGREGIAAVFKVIVLDIC